MKSISYSFSLWLSPFLFVLPSCSAYRISEYAHKIYRLFHILADLAFMKKLLDKIGKLINNFRSTKLIEYPAGSLDDPIVRTQNYDLGEAKDG